MKNITLKELVDLVVAEVPDSESRIQRMFEWHFEREMTISKWLLGAAASIFVAILISYFKDEFTVDIWQILVGIVFILGSFSYGVYRFMRIKNIHKQFVSALKLYGDLKNVAPFLSSYRSSKV